MSLSPIKPILRWKVWVHTFQKFKKKFEVGQLHALEGFLTAKNRENVTLTIEKNGQKGEHRGVVANKMFTFFVSPMKVLKHSSPFFWICMLD